MKRFLPLVVLLITLGFGCEECDGPDPLQTLWDEWRQKQEEDAKIIPPTNSILEDLGPLKVETTNTNSILEDLYPTGTTSLWINETDLNFNESGTEATWLLHLTFGDDSKNFDSPATGTTVTAEFRGGTGEEVMGVVGSDGWVYWVRPLPSGATQLYVTDVAGAFPWNTLDAEFWKDTPALSITEAELQAFSQ